MSHRPWPKLSVTLAGPREPGQCQNCGTQLHVGKWRECDDDDKPTPVVILLCHTCSDQLIEKHPRLYADLSDHAPAPGAMAICRDCACRDQLRCTHPALKANGGEGLKIITPRPTIIHYDGRTKGGKRFGCTVAEYEYEARECAGNPATAGKSGTGPLTTDTTSSWGEA